MKKFYLIFFIASFTSIYLTPAYADNKVWVFNCEYAFPPPVDSFFITCADGNEGIYKIKWSKWSQNGGEGIGVYGINNCRPDCAEGKYTFTRVKILLSKPKILNKRIYLSYIKWWEVDKNNNQKKDGKFGEWDLYKYFKEAGGKI